MSRLETHFAELDQALENRHLAHVAFDEPRPALSADSNELTAHRTVHVSVHDAVNIQRLAAQGVALPDRQLRAGFITVHWERIEHA